MAERKNTLEGCHTCSFHEALVCFGVCLGSTVKMQLHETTCTWAGTSQTQPHVHRLVFFTWLASDEGWRLVLGGPGITQPVCLTKKVKEQLFNSVPVHTHLAQQQFSQDPTHISEPSESEWASERGSRGERDGERNRVRSKRRKRKWDRGRNRGLPSWTWTYDTVLWLRHSDKTFFYLCPFNL